MLTSLCDGLLNRLRPAKQRISFKRHHFPPASIRLADWLEVSVQCEPVLWQETVWRIGKGPYRALNNDVSNATTFPPFFTLGGLRVDEDTGAVLDAGDRPIKGLYAAGRTAVGVCSNGYFSSGVSWQDCVFSGRRAARSALAM